MTGATRATLDEVVKINIGMRGLDLY